MCMILEKAKKSKQEAPAVSKHYLNQISGDQRTTLLCLRLSGLWDLEISEFKWKVPGKLEQVNYPKDSTATRW